MNEPPRPLNLILVRHAEAVGASIAIPDLKRPLSPRGQAQARLMGALLGFSGLKPGVIVCSHSERTVATARILAQAMNLDQDILREDPRLYMQNTSILSQVINSLPDQHSRIILVGHNPDISVLMGELSGQVLCEQPPCTVASLRFEADSWGCVVEGSGALDFCVQPERYDLTHDSDLLPR